MDLGFCIRKPARFAAAALLASWAVAPSVAQGQIVGILEHPGLYECQRDTPSPSLAAGSNYLLEVVNSKVGVFQKGTPGLVLWQNNLDTPGYSGGCFPTQPGLFQGAGATRIVEAKAVYDRDNDRFAIVGVQANGGGTPGQPGIYVAYSNTNIPLPNNLPTGCGGGGWRVWRTPLSAGLQTIGGVTYELDYTSVGQTQDFIFWSGILRPVSNPLAPAFVHARWFDKTDLLLAPATLPFGELTAPIARGTAEFPQAADNFDAGAPMLLVGATSSQNALRLSRANPGTSTLQEVTLNVPPFFPMVGGGAAPQNGGTTLDTGDSRIQGAVVRGDSLWCAHTVLTSFAIGARHVVRWYEVGLNGWPTSGQLPALIQSGNVDLGINGAGQGVHAFHPNVMVDPTGHTLLAFARSAANEGPGVAFAARRFFSPAGTMPLAGTIKSGMFQYTSSGVLPSGAFRWGNTTGISMDGQHPFRIWVAGAYAMFGSGFNPGSAWGTCPTVANHWETAMRFVDLHVYSSSSNYGTGWPGTFGTPAISIAPNPTAGNTSTVTITNSFQQPTAAVFALGSAPANIPSGFGGTILVDPATSSSVTVTMTAVDGQVALPIAGGPGLIGLSFFMQAAVLDPGASQGLAFTDGLTVTVGE